MTTLVSVDDVRQYLGLNATSSDSRYSDQTIGSNIRAAGAFLQRRTGRVYGDETATTYRFTTEGRALVPLPGLRTATTVTLAGATLTEDSTFYLIPDTQQTGVYTAMQFRAFQTRQGASYLSNPEWWDRGLDLPGPGRSLGGAYWQTSLPNDLIVLGDWGYTAAALPEEVRHATKVMASYITKRPDALLSGVLVSESGAFDLSNLPIEVSDFIRTWAVGPYVASIG